MGKGKENTQPVEVLHTEIDELEASITKLTEHGLFFFKAAATTMDQRLNLVRMEV